jgi:hypothetical protein
MELTDILAYFGSATGLISLYLYFIKHRREQPRLDIKLNDRKRNGISFRYPDKPDATDKWDRPAIDKENPIDVAFMSIQLINKSAFSISIISIEAYHEGLQCVHDEFPILMLDTESSLGFSKDLYIKLPLNIPAFETREAYLCVDLGKKIHQDPQLINIVLQTSRGTFNELISVSNYQNS